MTWLSDRARRLAGDEGASATIEFVILLPAFMLILLSTFELGMLMTRHVMLERGLDLAVRQVRLGTLAGASHAELVGAICDGIPVMRDCESDLRLEMVRLSPRDAAIAPAPLSCADLAASGESPDSFENGGRNELMLLRACALFDPMFPTTGLGATLTDVPGGNYALIATSSYVIEPI